MKRAMLKGLITIKDIEKAVKYPNSAKDEGGRLLCGAAIGATPTFSTASLPLLEAQVDVVVLDSAHGHNSGIMRSGGKRSRKLPGPPAHCRQRCNGEGTHALI